MKFSFHPEAEEELVYAIDYYEECSPGLGTDFSSRVSRGLLIIESSFSSSIGLVR